MARVPGRTLQGTRFSKIGVQEISSLRLRSGEVWFRASRDPSGYLLHWTRAGRFAISQDGRRLRARRERAAPLTSFRLVRRLACAYAGSLRGLESLHATALVGPATLGPAGPPGLNRAELLRHGGGKGGQSRPAVALLGRSGEGKSTLATHLLGEGWTLLSDDLLPVRIRGRKVLVRSSFPCLKLSSLDKALDTARGTGPGAGSDRLARLNLSGGGRESRQSAGRYDPNLEKWILRYPGLSGDFGLRAFCILARRPSHQGTVRMDRLIGAKAALAVQANFYNEILRPPRVLRQQFALAARLAGLVPVWRLSYPSGMRHLPRVGRRIADVCRP